MCGCESVNSEKKSLGWEEIVDVHPQFVLVSHHGFLDVVDALLESVSNVCKGLFRLAFEEEQFSEKLLLLISN